MSVKKSVFHLSLVGLTAISLQACSHPNAMPTGYTYHDDVYKSAVPPLPMDINDEQRTYMTATQARQFRDATYELLERLTMRAGISPKPMYVLAPVPMNNFYANIDNDLRESMRYVGYALSDTSDEAYAMTYNASAIDDSSKNENVRLTLRVFNKVGQDARLLTEETGEYYIEGADTLVIRPVLYASQPTPDAIRNQIKGYQRLNTSDAVRTAPYVETAPLIDYVPMADQAPLRPVPPMQAQPQPAFTQPMMVDPSVSVAVPTAPLQTNMPRAKRSNYISSDY